MKLVRRFGLIILVGSFLTTLWFLLFTSKCTNCKKNEDFEVEVDFQLSDLENEYEFKTNKKIGGEHSNGTFPLLDKNIPKEVYSRVKQLLKWYDLDVDRKELSVKDCWNISNNWVKLGSVHPEYTPELGAVLRALSTSRITLADVAYLGSQLKMVLQLEGNQTVIFKPRWYKRDKEIEGGPLGGHDRHNGEIVSFHLNRLLGFHRAPLAAGRVINFDKEILPVATKTLIKSTFKKGTRSCFVRKCTYCRVKVDYICTDKHTDTELEGVIINYLPEKFKIVKKGHPWRRTYNKHSKANWEIYKNYCHSVILTPPYNQGTILLDILDGAAFDYLIQNADRHHIEAFAEDLNGTLVLFDNGKSFGNSKEDDLSILAPIYQCCKIRKSTWLRLLLLKEGVLSIVLKQILSKDTIAPVLADSHYIALDRRLSLIIKTLNECIEKHGEESVIIVV